MNELCSMKKNQNSTSFKKKKSSRCLIQLLSIIDFRIVKHLFLLKSGLIYIGLHYSLWKNYLLVHVSHKFGEKSNSNIYTQALPVM